MSSTIAALLGVATIYTVFRAGTVQAAFFRFAQGEMPRAYDSANVSLACWYVGGVLAILCVHEAGHWWACRRYSVRTSGPYLFPLPLSLAGSLPVSIFLAFGTAGAWLRLRSRYISAPAKWDIAAAGLIAGIVATLVCTALGIAWSVDVAQISRGNHWQPSLFRWMVPDGIAWHPLLAASLFGWYLTAASLLPLPGLDGWKLWSSALSGQAGRARQWSMAGVGLVSLACWL